MLNFKKEHKNAFNNYSKKQMGKPRNGDYKNFNVTKQTRTLQDKSNK